MADKQYNVKLGFNADTSKAKHEIQNLQKELNKLTSVDFGLKGKNLDADLYKATAAVKEFQTHLQKATDVDTGKLDLSKLSSSLKASGKSLKDYSQSFLKLGPEGQKAFNSVTQSIMNAEVPLRRTNKLLNEMAVSLKNTIKWQISSSAVHAFMGAVQGAYGYVQDLDKSLNNIRIVTGRSADEMASFAKEANKAARELSVSTTAYTDAALIYYQQGLDDQQVKERTDATIKMANVTGENATNVSSYMTAIWNNFDDGSKSLEYFGDVITALGAKTAASSEEIAGGLEKFAAVGETVGLSYEYATAALATIIDKTRQSEDVVGTALKTIFARIQGLQQGETAEDGVTLNKYSQALANVGIQIMDTTGELKSMDSILNELGQRWQTLSKAEQVALAQTVGGTRQYTQLIALMDNWGSMQENLSTAYNSSGTLEEQAKIYAESWEAAQKRVTSALQKIYSELLNDEFFIGVTNMVGGAIELFGKLIDTVGGLPGVLAISGVAMAALFKDQIPQLLRGTGNMIKDFTGASKSDGYQLKEDASIVNKELILSDINDEGLTQEKVGNRYAARQSFIVEMEKSNKYSKEEIALYKERIEMEKQWGEAVVENAKKSDEIKNKIAQNKKDQDKLLGKLSKKGDSEKLQSDWKEYQKTGKLEGYSQKELKNLKAYNLKLEENKKLTKENEEVSKNLEKGLSDLDDIYAENNQNMGLYNEESQKCLNTMEQGFISAGKAIASFTMLVATGPKIFKILNDDSMSIFDKIEAIVPMLLVAIPALVTTIKNASAAMVLFNAEGQKGILIKTAELLLGANYEKQVGKELTLETLLTALKKKLNAEESKSILVKTADWIVTKMLGGATAGAAGATLTLAGALGSLLAAAAPFLIAGAALIGIFLALKANSPEEKLKRANEELEKSRKAAQDASNAYNDLKSSLDSLSSAQDTLSGLTKGTLEWKEAVLKVNQQVLDLIEKYPELAAYMTNEDGVLGISEEGIEKITNKTLNEANALQRSAMSDQRNVVEQENAIDNGKFSITYADKNATAQYNYDPLTGETTYVPATGTISNSEAKNIASNLQYDENGNFDLEATLDAAGIKNASDSFKQAIIDNLPELEQFKNNIAAADLEIQKLDTGIAKTWLSTHATDIDPETADFVATGMGQIVDGIKDQMEKDYNLSDAQAKRAYAQSILGPNATESEIQDYIKKIDEKIKNGDLTMETIKESIISSAANYEAYLKVQEQIAKADKYKGQDGYDVVKNIMASGGDASSFNALTTEEYDQFKQMAFDENGKLKAEFADMFKIFGDDFIATLEKTFSDENREQYEKESQENQDALFDKKVDQTASGLGVDSDSLAAYVQHLQETNESLKDNREAALAAAEANIRWNKGIDNLSSVLDDNADALKKSNKGTWDYYEALGKVKKAASDLLGIEVSTEYAEEHLEDLQKAVDGDEEAIKRLQQTAAVDWAKTFVKGVQDVKDEANGIDFNAEEWTSKFMDAIDDVAATLGALDTDVHLGADSSEIDAAAQKSIEDMIELANQAMAAGQMTEAEMRQMFGSMGYSPEVTYEEVPQESRVEGHVKVGPLTIPYENVSVNTVKVPKIADANNDGNVSLTKISTASSLSQSTGKGGGKGGGGGSKPKGKDVERYHTVNKELESLRKQLESVEKAKDNAFNEEDRLKAMEKEIALYDKIIAKEKEKLALIEKDLSKDKSALEKFGADIDPETGAVLNYEELMKKWNKDLESGKLSQEDYDKRIEALEQWEETWALWEDQVDVVAEETANKISAELANIEIKAEAKIKFNEQELKYLDHLLTKLEDKSFAAAEKMGLLGNKLENALAKYDINVDKLHDLMAQSGLTLEEAVAVMTGTASKEILDKLNDEQEEAFLKLGEDFMSNAEDIAALQQEMTQTLIDSITEAVDEYGKLGDEINHVTGTLEHYKNLIDILGEEKLGVNAADVAKLMQKTVDSSMANLANSQSTLKWLQDEKARLTAALEGASEAEKEAIKKALEETEAQIRDAESQVQSDLESVLNMIVEQFELHVKQAAEAFEKEMSGTFGSLEKLQEAFDREKQLDDLYVDDYKKVYELTKLTRDISKSMDETDNIKSKQALRDLQQEINNLQKDGTKLSEYDIDMLRKKYDLRLAEIALEEAQNAKSQVRMTRDSEGNWSYTYTADESSIAEAEQAYEDKLYAMQETNQEYIKNLQSQFLATQAEMSQALQALGPNATEEQIKAVKDHYQALMDAQSQQMRNALGDSNYALGFMAEETEGWVNSFDETTLSMLTGFKTLESYQTAFTQSTNDMVDAFKEALSVYNTNVDDAMAATGQSIEDFGKKLTEVQDKASKDLAKIEQDTKDLAKKATESTTGALSQLQDSYEKYGAKAEIATANTWELVEAVEALAEAQEKQTGLKTEDTKSQEDIIAEKIAKVKEIEGKLAELGFGGIGSSDVSEEDIKKTEEIYLELMKKKYAQLDDYTGQWNPYERLAVSSGAEAILNPSDADNMIKIIDAISDISKQIDFNAANAMISNFAAASMPNGNQGIVQEITINAEFPDATNRDEISAAFDSLLIRASQYANRK